MPTLIASSIFASSLAWACATGGRSLSATQVAELKSKWTSFNDVLRRGRMPASNPKPPQLPTYGGAGDLTPWGGDDFAHWRAEAIWANAASLALNDGWNQNEAAEVIVSAPTKFYDSGWHPYGDGQSNAKISFEGWKAPRPPLTATLIKFTNGKLKVYLRFDRRFEAPTNKIEVRYKNAAPIILEGTRQGNGDLVAEWNEVPAALEWNKYSHRHVAYMQPQGSTIGWLPVYFRIPTQKIEELLLTVPQDKRRFGDGAPIVDGGHVRPKHNGELTAFERLLGGALDAKWNPHEQGRPYTPPNIHAIYKHEGESDAQGEVTAVGMGWTWVAQDKTPFKIMYTCFDARNLAGEVSAPNGGVPSGGGWHAIGDLAETILNSVELESATVGAGFTAPASYEDFSTPDNKVAYGLNDIAVVRWLRPGEAFTTVAANEREQKNYHWFFFNQKRPVCTEEWVHPCRPTHDAPDFSCQ